MNLHKAKLEVDKIKSNMGNAGHQYRSIQPSKIDHKPAIFTFVMSFVSIAGVIAGIYFYM